MQPEAGNLSAFSFEETHPIGQADIECQIFLLLLLYLPNNDVGPTVRRKTAKRYKMNFMNVQISLRSIDISRIQ